MDRYFLFLISGPMPHVGFFRILRLKSRPEAQRMMVRSSYRYVLLCELQREDTLGLPVY
jgi:hypothetical protein